MATETYQISGVPSVIVNANDFTLIPFISSYSSESVEGVPNDMNVSPHSISAPNVLFLKTSTKQLNMKIVSISFTAILLNNTAIADQNIPNYVGSFYTYSRAPGTPDSMMGSTAANFNIPTFYQNTVLGGF